MRIPSSRVLTLLAVALPPVAACASQDPTAATQMPSEPSHARFALAPGLPAPDDFVDPATGPNPYFPLIPGTVWTYEAETEDGLERTVDRVTNTTRTIQGIPATVVLDQVYLEGELIERTNDWYAQDQRGNVWYLGESSCEFEEPGGPCDPAGSWEAGVDGAEAGIVMWADPLARKAKTYRQEYYEGEAEDMAKVLHGDLTVTVEAGTFTDCIETMDWTPLEPGAREHKFYCAGVGLVLEVQPKGGRVRNQLVNVAGLVP
jgi:hypothetical protein